MSSRTSRYLATLGNTNGREVKEHQSQSLFGLPVKFALSPTNFGSMFWSVLTPSFPFPLFLRIERVGSVSLGPCTRAVSPLLLLSPACPGGTSLCCLLSWDWCSGTAEDVPAHCREAGTTWPLQVPSDPNYSVILWNTPFSASSDGSLSMWLIVPSALTAVVIQRLQSEFSQ